MLPGLLRKTHEPAGCELVKRILSIDRGKPRDPLSPPCHDDLDTPLDAVQVFAEPVMQCTHSHLALIRL